MLPKRVEVLGVPVDCVDMAGALAAIETLIAGDRCRSVIAVNPEKIIRAQRDLRLLEVMRRAGLLIPDGIGVVKAAALLNVGSMQRVAGSDLMPELCGLAVNRGWSIYVYGGKAEVNAAACAELIRRFPELEIAGRAHGYQPEDRTAAVIDDINASGARILFVALGSPKQELWMDTHAPSLGVKVCQGIGGTLDVLAGTVRRAPRLIRDLNLEWFYRLASQPSRLARQTALAAFALQVLRQRLLH